MKNIREIITDLNVARSNSCSQEKSEEIKGIIQHLLTYAEIEGELGICLVTLSKTKSVFVKDAGNCICEMTEFGWDFANKRIVGLAGFEKKIPIFAFFKDYGKTWALTKEELLCQK